MLLERYRGVLPDAGYPVLRLEEMMGYTALSEVEVHGHRRDRDRGDGPRGEDPTRWMREMSRSRDGGCREGGSYSYSYEELSVETSHTVEFAFNENASRSRMIAKTRLAKIRMRRTDWRGTGSLPVGKSVTQIIG